LFIQFYVSGGSLQLEISDYFSNYSEILVISLIFILAERTITFRFGILSEISGAHLNAI